MMLSAALVLLQSKKLQGSKLWLLLFLAGNTYIQYVWSYSPPPPPKGMAVHILAWFGALTFLCKQSDLKPSKQKM
jgi:hypothetical protein